MTNQEKSESENLLILKYSLLFHIFITIVSINNFLNMTSMNLRAINIIVALLEMYNASVLSKEIMKIKENEQKI